MSLPKNFVRNAAIVYLVKCLSSKEEKSVQFRLAARRSVLKYAIIQFIRTVNIQQLDIFNIRSNNEVIELDAFDIRSGSEATQYSIDNI